MVSWRPSQSLAGRPASTAGTAPARWTAPADQASRARSNRAGCNDAARSASGGRCRIAVPGAWTRVSPDSSVPRRPAVDSPRSGQWPGGSEGRSRLLRIDQPGTSASRPAAGGPSRTEQPCHTLCWPCLDPRSGGPPGTARLAELTRPRPVHAMEGGRSQPIRGAA